MRAKWVDITIWLRESGEDLKSLHHLTIDNKVVAVLALWKTKGQTAVWMLYTPEVTGGWDDLPRVHLGDAKGQRLKANNAETAKIRATSALVLRWQELAVAGIRLLGRIEEGG